MRDRHELEAKLIRMRQLREEASRRAAEQSLYEFYKQAWPNIDPAEFVGNWHLEAIAEHLEAVNRGDIKRLVINVPPRSSKTAVCSIAWGAWTWLQDPKYGPNAGPATGFIHTSYALNLSLEHAIKQRRLLQSEWYQERWGDRFHLLEDQNKQIKFENDKGGHRTTTSVDGTLTGRGASILVVDDPHNLVDAESDATRKTTVQWFREALPSRLNDQKTGAIVVIMQRVHEEDVSGAALDMGYEHLCHDEATEVLTRRGFLPFKDLKITDEVMGVNPITHEGNWEHPTEIISYPYTGPMYQYKSLTADFCVTPDHRMLISDGRDMKGGNRPPLEVCPAHKLPSYFYVPNVPIGPFYDNEPVCFGGASWDPVVFAKFMGWYLSEGHACAKSTRTIIVQKEGPKAEALREVMRQVPFKVITRERKKGDAAGMWEWCIYNKALAAALEVLGLSHEKHAPPELFSLSKEASWAFITAYCNGDGNRPVRNPNKMIISSRSRQMIDDLQAIALRCGASASVSSGYVPESTLNGYTLPAGTMWRLYIRVNKIAGASTNRKWYSQIRRDKHLAIIDYSGPVYCVTVPSTAFVTRRNGRTLVAGNCIPMRNDTSRHCITGIGWEEPRTEDGELMWPARFPREAVDRLEKEMGPVATAAQHQQMPTPRGGGIIKRDWWKYWGDDLPPGVKATYPPFSYLVASLDPAYTEKQENDYSAFSIWGVFYEAIPSSHAGVQIEEPKIMLAFAWRDRLPLHELVERVHKDCEKFHVDTLLVEAKASGISVQQELRRLFNSTSYGVQMYNPKGDKVARVHAVSHFFYDGLVYTPDKAWAQKVVDQVSVFPKGAHDDDVDAMSAALLHLRKSGLLVRKEEAYDAVEEDVRRRPIKGKLYPC